MENIRRRTKQLTTLAMMLALIVTLSALEHMLPPLPVLPSNVRLGLSNIVTMYVLFFMGWRQALTLAALKSTFVLLMRGAMAGVLSLCGGLLSILAILLLRLMFRTRISYLLLSIAGAISHNVGQILAAGVLLRTNAFLYTLPVLVISGVLFGSVTGIALRVVIPLFDKTLGNSGRNL